MHTGWPKQQLDNKGPAKSILMNSGVEIPDRFHCGLDFINNTFSLRPANENLAKNNNQGRWMENYLYPNI